MVQINNNNKILPPYIINTFYLYYKSIQKLLDNCGKIQEAYQQANKLLTNSNGHE